MEPNPPVAGAVARASIGGVLMGLANLVPGISGGTMLLAAGVYPQFIGGVAEVSTFRFRLRSLLVLACVVGGALIAIVALAGTVKGLVINHSWVMYSLFIGLTLGGVPVIWRMVRPVDPTVVVSSIAGILAMVGLVLVQAGHAAGQAAAGGDQSADTARLAMLLLAGAAGGAAMILPGVSGGYLLLVLGQYVVILGAIEGAREALVGRDWAGLGTAMKVFAPVAAGVVIGVVGVSNVVKILLDRFPRATLGFLLGLLLGAVVGLWPFQAIAEAEAVPPPPVTPLRLATVLGLVAAGLAVSVAVSHIGGGGTDNSAES